MSAAPSKTVPTAARPGASVSRAWLRALEKLSENHAGLRKVAAGFSEDQLQEKAAGPDYTRYQVLHGMIQHDLYHAGQIAILKKALGQ